MASQNPNPSEADLLDALRERIRTTQEAVERIAAEAQAAADDAQSRGSGGQGASASRHRRPPAVGYAVPGDAAGRGDGTDVQALIALIELARKVVGPELAPALADLLRELLLLARALIDWSLDRLGGQPDRPVEAQDIPIT